MQQIILDLMASLPLRQQQHAVEPFLPGDGGDGQFPGMEPDSLQDTGIGLAGQADNLLGPCERLCGSAVTPGVGVLVRPLVFPHQLSKGVS